MSERPELCERVQWLLGGDSPQAVAEDPELAAHLRDCVECRAVGAALERVDRALAALPARPPPAQVVSVVEAGARSKSGAREARRPGRWTRRLARYGEIAALLVLAVTLPAVLMVEFGSCYGCGPVASWIATAPSLHEAQEAYEPERLAGGYAPAADRIAMPQASSEVAFALPDADAVREIQAAAPRPVRPEAAPAFENRRKNAELAPAPPSPASFADDRVEEDVLADGRSRDRVGARGERARNEPNAGPMDKDGSALRADESVLEVPLSEPGKLEAFAESRMLGGLASADEASTDEPQAEGEARSVFRQRRSRGANERAGATGRPGSDVGRAAGQGAMVGGEAKATVDRLKRSSEAAAASPRELAATTRSRADNRNRSNKASTSASTSAANLARRYLAQRERVDGLAFQPSHGLWRNTYRPGSPRVRLLEVALQRWDRSAVESSLGALRLDRGARPDAHPFDPPRQSALAVYLHADREAASGPARVRLQVGLRGADRQGGLRQSMNIAVVVDRRQALDTAVVVRLRALLQALAAARQPGDRFTLSVAGPGGGLTLGPDGFRHGPLSVALDDLARREGPDSTPDPTNAGATGENSLIEVLGAAFAEVAHRDDPQAPLGASTVLLAGVRAVDGAEAEAVESMLHRGVLQGIATSVIALGSDGELPALERWALTGQGQLRVLDDASRAAVVLDRVLHGASGAVARAVRVNIALAGGVRLLGVLGSDRLEAPAAERVRAAEQAIDRRLARNLGIVGDRDEDDAGIQILIPQFQAGDSHVIVLDVLVPGPGKVADLSVRYKDLVYLRNGVAHASYSLASGESERGPLERSVVKSELAWRFSEAVTTAAVALARDEPARALAVLARHRDLLQGLREVDGGFESDRDIGNDIDLLGEYLAVVQSPLMRDRHFTRSAARSLRGAGHRRLHGSRQPQAVADDLGHRTRVR